MRSPLSFPLLAASLALVAACDSGVEEKEKEKIPPPVIVSFTVDPGTIEQGNEATLAWSVRDAVSVEIADHRGNKVDLGALATAQDGSIVVGPAETVTFTLSAHNAGGVTTRTAELKVIDTGRPRVTISASPSKITLGETATLTWTTSGATSLSLREGTSVLEEGAELSGSRQVNPDRTVTYHADAEGPGGVESKSTKVEVMAAIDSFEVDDEGPVLKGAPVKLSWTVRGADKLVLSNLDGFEQELDESLLETGTATAPAGNAGAFRLTAFRSGTQSNATARVDLVGVPKITRLESSPSAVTEASAANQIAVTIFWEVDGADAVSLAADPGGILVEDASDPSGSVGFLVEGNTRFTLTALNAAGPSSREIRVLSYPAPAVASFETDKLLVGAGEPVRLQWKTSAANRVDLLANDAVVATGLALEGGIVQMPQETTTYALRATNAAGTSAERKLVVEVGPPVIDAFGADPSEGPAGSTVRLSWSIRGANAIAIGDEFDFPLGGCPADPADVEDGECVATLPPGEGEIEWTLYAGNSSGESSQSITLKRWEEVAP